MRMQIRPVCLYQHPKGTGVTLLGSHDQRVTDTALPRADVHVATVLPARRARFQPVKVSTARMNLAASWAQKAWPASSKRSSFAPGTVLARSWSLATGMN